MSRRTRQKLVALERANQVAAQLRRHAPYRYQLYQVLVSVALLARKSPIKYFKRAVLSEHGTETQCLVRSVARTRAKGANKGVWYVGMTRSIKRETKERGY
jgi:hypothetical protein